MELSPILLACPFNKYPELVFISGSCGRFVYLTSENMNGARQYLRTSLGPSSIVPCGNHGFNLLKHLHLGTGTKVTAICIAYSQAQNKRSSIFMNTLTSLKHSVFSFFDTSTS